MASAARRWGGLVIEAGWPLPVYKAWLYTTLVRQLLAAGSPDAMGTHDLSFGPLIDAE
jgi:hypothetical protein